MLYKNEQLFDIADDDEVIEALIFERKALGLRFSGLLSRAKSLGITADYPGERSVGK